MSRKLSRKSAARKSLLRNLAVALISYESITTTEAKAKEVSVFVNRLISRSRSGSLSSRRLILAKLNNRLATAKIFEQFIGKIGDQTGGFTRIYKLAPRSGDNAPQAVVSLLDKFKTLPTSKKDKTEEEVKGNKTKIKTEKLTTAAKAKIKVTSKAKK